MYDKKYLAVGKEKKIQTTSEAAAILVFASRGCHTTECDECPVMMYSETRSCTEAKAKALTFLSGLGNIIRFSDALLMFDTVADIEGDGVCKTVRVEPEGTCENCAQMKSIGDVMMFCRSFHNLTHPDGFCYRYEPVDKSPE